MTSLWRYAIQNLARSKRRNVATGFAIGLGFAALLALGGYTVNGQRNLQADAIYNNRTGHIAIYKKGGLDGFSSKPQLYSLNSAEQITIEHTLARTKQVEAFTPLFYGSGLIGNGCKSLPFIATGIEPKIEQWLRDHPHQRSISRRRAEAMKGEALAAYPDDFGAVALSSGLARLLGKPKVISDFESGEPPLVFVDCFQEEAKDLVAQDANVQMMSVGWDGMTSALDGEVVAHFSTGNSSTENLSVLLPLRNLQKLYGTDHVTHYSVWLKDESELAAVKQGIEKQLLDKGLKIDIYQWNDERINPMYTGTVDFLYTLIGFITAILVTIIVFSILNATTITVIERSREVGMLRSFGFTRRQVQALFVREMLALTAISLVAGGIVGGVGIFLVGLAGITFQPPGVVGGIQLKLAPDLATILQAMAVIFIVATLATWAVVRRLTRMRIAFLLSNEQR